jgi:hypothetical protein
MHKKVTLPKSFAPFQTSLLIRLGRNNDGGYLIDSRNIQASTVLIGMGLSDDWSFEADFVNLKKLPVYAYDKSVSRKLFAKKFLRSIFKFRKPNEMIRNFETLRNYNSFFRGDIHHIEKFVGENPDVNYVSLQEVLDTVDPFAKSRIFLKIDIEGSEYRLLEEILANSVRIEGMVIEFHDAYLHAQRIESFIQNFSLTLIHVHSNNCAFVTKNGSPTALECTFTSQPVGDSIDLKSPHVLDMPCTPGSPEHAIVFR